MLDVERRCEASVVVREYEDDGLGLLYYDLNAADGDVLLVGVEIDEHAQLGQNLPRIL